jgi:hypothetical protein
MPLVYPTVCAPDVKFELVFSELLLKRLGFQSGKTGYIYANLLSLDYAVLELTVAVIALIGQ